MLSLVTPENLPGVLTAVATLLGGGGILTWLKIRREPPKPGTPDAAAVALAENTKATLAMVAALNGQTTQFAANNDLFKQVVGLLADIKHDTAENKAHLAAIRDELIRRGR